jgi:xylose isomerase
MRNYLILKEKARQFDEDQEIKGLLAEISNGAGSMEPLGSYSAENAKRVKELPLDRAELARKSLPYERLDQLTVDILLGVRQ